MYTATITDFPVNQDPLNTVVQVTIANGTETTIVRNYSIPTATSPTPADFQLLIQADLDALNASLQATQNIATQFIQNPLKDIPLASLLIADQTAILSQGNPATPVETQP